MYHVWLSTDSQRPSLHQLIWQSRIFLLIYPRHRRMETGFRDDWAQEWSITQVLMLALELVCASFSILLSFFPWNTVTKFKELNVYYTYNWTIHREGLSVSITQKKNRIWEAFRIAHPGPCIYLLVNHSINQLLVWIF